MRLMTVVRPSEAMRLRYWLSVLVVACGGPIEPLLFVVTPPTVNIAIGETEQLTTTIVDVMGETVTGREIAWTSSDPGVATVSPTGLVTGISGGNTNILLAAEGVKGNVPVTVIPTTSGRWSGSAQGTLLGLFTLNLKLSESEAGEIIGNGNIVNAVNVAIVVTGTRAHPNVSMNLDLSSGGFAPINYSGQLVDDNTITGTLNGSGFTNFAMTIRRQGVFAGASGTVGSYHVN